MFKKLFENTSLKPKGETPHNAAGGHSPAVERHHTASSSPARAVATPVVEIASPSYDQWLSTLLNTYSSITVPKLKSLWQDFTLSKTDKDKLTKLNKVLYAFIVLCEQKKIDPKNLTDVFGSNRVFSFNIARRVVKDLKDLWPKQPREQCGRLSLQYLSTQGGDSCGYELLYILEKLVSHETNLDACVEAALPSTLSRVLHLFFAIPFPSLESAASVVDRTFNVVATLCSYPAVAEELVRADALYLLFATVTLECSPNHRKMRDRMTSLMLTFVRMHMNTYSSTYCSNKGIMQNLIFEMANYSNFSPEEIIALCKLMLELIRETLPHAQGLLLNDFVSAGGYTFWLHTLLRLETIPPTQENTNNNTNNTKNNNTTHQLVDSMLDVVCETVYTGPSPLTLSVSAETSYSTSSSSSSSSSSTPSLHPETTPNLSGNTSGPHAVRNIEAFTVLQNYFLQSSQPSCRVKVLDRLLSVYAANPVNFLLLQNLHTLAHFIEDFESYTVEVKDTILRVVLFVVTVVNCVPFQELSSLSCLLQDSPSSSTLMLIFHTISKLVNFDHRYKNILRESGLLDMLVKLLKRGHDQIKQSEDDPTANQHNKLPLDAYAIVIDSLGVLAENSRDNLNILRDWGCIVWVLEMVTQPTTRPAALRLILQAIRLDTSVENSHGDLASLVRLLQVSPKTACLLKKDILNTIRRAFSMAKITKDLFRETGGFVSLVSTLVGFEGDFTQGKDMCEPMQLLEAVFKTITAAISQHPANRLFFEEQIGYATLTSAITMMGVLGTPYSPHVIDFLFEMAFDSTSPVSANLQATNFSQPAVPSTKWEAQYERAQILNREAISVILEILPISASLDLHLEVTKKMNVLAAASRHNREALTKLGIPHLILTRFQSILSENFEQVALTLDGEDKKEDKKEDDGSMRTRKELQKQLLLLLQTVGTNSLTAAELKEFFRLLQPANSPPILLRTLSLMSNAGYNPSYIEFSNYKHGIGCIHFPSIGDRPWAPANGYTVSFWMCIDKWAEENPVLDLFTIGTEDRKTHLSAHLRGGTLVVNSAYGGSGRLEFPTARISEEGRWYHVALVHTRGRFRRLQGGSEMRVYVDGYAKGTQKVHYTSSSHAPGSNVGVWIGLTERMVDPRSDHRMSRPIIALDQIWRLGPAYLIEEPLSSTQVNTIYNLGPTYHANFQGKFSPYQVFEVITSENLEAVKYGTQMGSLILDSASFTIPEEHIIFAFNASNSQEGIHSIHSFSKLLFLSLFRASRVDKSRIDTKYNRQLYIQIDKSLQVANASDLDINESIINAADLSGTSKGKLIGGVEAVNRSTVATSISTVGGVSVVFLLIEKAETSEALHQALIILSGIIKYNYKNTAEMDAVKGYLVVSLLLKRKAHIINEEIVDLLFDLSGATSTFTSDGLREWGTAQQAANAILNNRTHKVPLISNNHVVKNILLYYEIWKGTSVELQQSVLHKLSRMFIDNPQASFNSYFMRKVHESISEDVHPFIIDVVEGIWKERMTEEDIRTITHFLIGVLYNSENKKAMIYKREQELSTRAIRVCNMVLDMLLRLILAAHNKNIFYKVITTNWIFCFIDEILPASTVNLTLRILTALAQHKSAFYTRFRKDGGIRLLERVLPAFCVHASVFHTLLYLLLGKPITPTITPIQFEFLELFHHFKHNNETGAPVQHEIKAVEAAHLILAMAKRSYEESQVQAAAGFLSLSSSTNDLSAAEQLAMTGGNVGPGSISPSFAAMLASAHHPPTASVAREGQANAAATTVFSLVGSFINKVEQSVSREGSREFSGENAIPVPDGGSPPLHRKKSSVLNLGGSWRPTSPAGGNSVSQPSTPPFTHSSRHSSSGLPPPSTSSSSSSSSTSSSTSSTPSTSAPPTPTLSHSASSHHIHTPAAAATSSQRPHKVQQSLLKFMMYLFDSSHDFQVACTQLEFMERLIAIAFPNGSLAVGESEDDTMKIDDTVSLVFQFVTLIIDVSLKTSTRATTVIELGLEATPLSVTERQLSQYHGKLLRDVMNTLLQSFTRADFLEADRERLPANLGRFCHLLVDRCRTNLFPNGARPVFRFLVRLLEKLEGEQSHNQPHMPHSYHHSHSQHSYSSAGTDRASHHSSHQSSRARDGSTSSSSNPNADLVPVFKALNRTILLLLGNTSYGTEPDLVLTFNAIIRNQRVVFSPLNLDHDFIFSLCYQLYKYLLADSKVLREPALVIWKALMQNKLDVLNEVLVYKTPKGETVDLRANGFDLLMHDPHSFLFWLGDEGTQSTISAVFDEHLKKVWVAYQIAERKTTLETAKHIETRRAARITRRERKVTADVTNHAKIDAFRDKHLVKSVEQEQANYKQKRQLESDRIQFVTRLWDSLKDQLTRERAVWGPATLHPLEKWKLDPTEGPYRMRKKVERNKEFYQHYPFYESTVYEEITRKQGIPPPTSKDSEAYYMMLKGEGRSTNEYYIKPSSVRATTPVSAQLAEIEGSPGDEKGKVDGSQSPSRATSPLIGALTLPERPELLSPEYTLHIIDNLVPEESNPTSPSAIPSLSSASPLALSPPPSSSSIVEDTLLGEENKDLGSDDESDDDEPTSGVSTAITGADEVSVKDATEQIVDEEEEQEVGLRLRRRLEPNEHIQSIINCASVDGLDRIDGILLFCNTNLYVIDGYSKDPKGDDIIEVEEKSNTDWALAGTASSGVVVPRRALHTVRKWAFEDIREVLKRRYLLRQVAIELFSSDGRNHLVVFSDVAVRDEVFQKLSAIIAINASADAALSGGQSVDSAEGVKDKIGSMLGKRSQILTQKWVSGQISNFQYLMHLNTLAGRSYNDLTQYPVFPWVLQDFDSPELDLNNPSVYRDLSKPMGAITEPRAEKFRERFENWVEESEEEDGKIIPKFHYGTHYSSAAIVLYFLIRLEPFTQHHLKLQGGRWDQADRLFHSISETWFTSSSGSTGSVMELIPEFYYLPDFLENRNGFNLGERQTTGEPLADVVLPNWAHGSAREFVRKHRQALESDYVSEHLHEWIDLIFGYKQQGKAAEEALNVFYYLTYEGAVDIDAILDPVQKAATIAQIDNFGQTPRQIFDKPHPRRQVPTSIAKPFYTHVPIYSMVVKDTGEPVGNIRTVGEKVHAMGFNKISIPPAFSRHISWSLPDGSIRMMQGDKLVHILENSHNGKITCMAPAEDGKVIVSGGVDTVVCVYKVRKNDFALMKRLCGHTKSVTCVAVSRAYSVIVSGSEDLSCIIWDLNSLGHHESPVTAAAVHEISGEILTCSANTVNVWSINGDLLLSAKTSQNPLDFITCCLWSKGPEWVHESVLISGHKDGKIKVWSCTPTLKNSSSSSSLSSFSSSSSSSTTPLSMTMKQKTQLTNGLHTSAITALSLSTESQRLYSGDTEGKVVIWAETDLSSKPSRTLPMFNPTDLIHMIKKRGDDLVP